MVSKLSPGRKDDLESLIYILCFLHSGKLPIINWINMNWDQININQFIEWVLVTRKENMQKEKDETRILLPKPLRSAFEYILSLDFKDKPDYCLLRLWLSTNAEDDIKAVDVTQHLKKKLKSRDNNASPNRDQ